jgi:hypothetical protein
MSGTLSKWTPFNFANSGLIFADTIYDGVGTWIALEASEQSNGIWRSTDGVSWSQSGVTISGGNYYYEIFAAGNIVGKFIAYNSGTWIAVGQGIWRSTNGTSWTKIPNTGNFLYGFFDVVADYPRQVYYSIDRWVVVGSDTQAGFAIIYSTNDGLTWNMPSGNPFAMVGFGGIRGVCNSIATNGGSRWVGVGSNSIDASKQIYFSTDSAGSFAPATFTPALDQTVFAWVTYGANKFVAVASQDNQGRFVWYSADGSSWAPATNTAGPSIPIMSNGGTRVAYNGTQFVAIGAGSETTDDSIYYSPDGINWTKASSTVPGQLINWNGYGIQYNSGLWVAAGFDSSNNNLWTSPDGITWTPGVSAVTGTAIFDNGVSVSTFSGANVDWGNNRWVAVGRDLNRNFAWSASTQFPPPCFLEGSKILTDKGYVPVEDLRKGDMVKTVLNGFVPIHAVGVREIEHQCLDERDKDQLYLCSPKNYPELTEDLVITGCHSVLVPRFESPEQRAETKKVLGDNYVTDGHYRLPACVDRRAEVYSEKGEFNVYHIALENSDYYMNYGVYANGLLVESTSKRYLLKLSGMKLLE